MGRVCFISPGSASGGTYRLGVDPTRRDVERELAHADAHTAHSQISQPQYPRSVRHDADLEVLLGDTRLEVREDRADVREIERGEV